MNFIAITFYLPRLSEVDREFYSENIQTNMSVCVDCRVAIRGKWYYVFVSPIIYLELV